MNHERYRSLSEDEVRLLIEFRDDRSRDAAWRSFNEATRRLDREMAEQTTPEERLLALGRFVQGSPRPQE